MNIKEVDQFVKFQTANDRLVSIESFCMKHKITPDELKSKWPKIYVYLKMAVRHHLMEGGLLKKYQYQVVVSLLEFDQLIELEDRIDAL